MTAYSLTCAWCQRPFAATAATRNHCSLPCQQRHTWYGVRPESNVRAVRGPKGRMT